MGALAKTFGTRVKALRKSRRLTQSQLAESAEVSEQWIRRIEAGEGAPSFETIEAVAAALNVHAADLFGEPAAPSGKAAQFAIAAERLSDESAAWLLEGARLLGRPRQSK